MDLAEVISKDIRKTLSATLTTLFNKALFSVFIYNFKQDLLTGKSQG